MHFDIQSATVQFDAIPALSSVSLEIPDGSFLLLTGPTGAGKTTLLKMLYADVLPTKGKVFAGGQDTAALNTQARLQLRRKMGVIFQDGKLLPNLTVFENVSMPLIINGVDKKDANTKTLDILADIGISYVRDKFPDKLSGGERHLAGLARAIIHQPDTIIADEPTGNLDGVATDKIAGFLHREAKRGATVIVATHDPYFASHFATQAMRVELTEGEVTYKD